MAEALDSPPVLEVVENLNQQSLNMLYDSGKLTTDNREAVLTHEQAMKGAAELWSDSKKSGDCD
jgi:hypothetical protein